MGKSIKSVVKLVTAPIKAMYDPVGAFKDVFGGVQGVFAGLTGAAKISGGPSSEPSSQTVRSSKAPVRFILGRASTGGVLAWVQEQSGDQTSGEWIHIVYVLSEGAIAGVDEIYVDERPLSDLGENATSEVIIDPTQVNAFLLANCPDWRQEQIGRGLSFVRLSFKYDAEKFPSGIPDVRFVVRGRSDIYDPRNGNSGYSANTALLILWYLRNRCAIPDDEIIFQSFASAANICDETVIGPDGKMSPRYFAGAVIGADEKRNTVLDNLLSACAGTLIRVGGRWSLQVGAYYGPADFTINEDMVIGTVEGTTEVSNSDAINTMRGTFVDPAQAWAETDYPEVAIQDWIATDGGELAESQSFAYVTDAYLAQRLANISLRRRRSGGSLSVPLNFNGYNCRPGRAVKVDLPSLNILGEFMVIEWTMGAADACKVTLKPYEQAIFDDAVGQPYDPLGFINLPVGGLAAVTGLAWTPSGVAEVVQGVLSWAPPAQTVLSYTVTIRKGAEVAQSLKIGGEASSCNINGLTSGTYAMSVVAFGPGTRSGEATINVNVGGPPVPESCAVYASVDTITLVPANLQNSLNGGTYEYFYATNPSAPIADAVYLGQGLTFTHTGLAFAKEYSYYVRSANAYGKSDFLYVLAATSSDPTQMLEVIAGQITESELGQELTKRIDLIDMNGPGSVNERVGAVRNELNQQVGEVNDAIETVKSSVTDARNELQQQLAAVDQEVDAARSELQQQINTVSALAGSLPYNKDKAYTLNQGVLGGDGKLYQALKAVPKNNPPPNATYWTDVGQAIVTAAGTATRVGKVETDVSTLNGTSTAQATKIEGLQSGLTTTNGNVTAAQQAAQAAATAAGAKGEVIYGTTAPAADKRLTQNLWIDTTGNANTPKRWNGSTWVAVTDKVATDAAAAAQSALTEVAKKADASTVQSLSNTVTQQGQDLTAQGQAMTAIDAAIGEVGGENLLYNPTFNRASAADANVPDGWVLEGSATRNPSMVSSWLNSGERAFRVAVTGVTNASPYLSLVTQSTQRPKVASGQSVTTSVNVRRMAESGLLALRIIYQWINEAGGVISAPANGFVPITVEGSRHSFTSVAPEGAVRFNVYFRIHSQTAAAVNGSLELARPQSEYGSRATGWRDNGQVTAGEIAANVSTTSLLSGRVEQTEQGLVTHGQSIVTLQGGLTTTNQGVTAAQQAAQAAATAAGAKGEVIYGSSAPAADKRLAQNLWIDTTGNANTPKRWNGSTWVAVTDKVATDAAAAAANALSVAQSKADASVVQNLSTKVSDNEGKLTTQGQLITGLQNSLSTTNGNVTTAQQAAQAAATAAGAKGEVIYGSAAPATDKRLAQNLWIDTTGNANTPKRWNGSAWVAVTDKVATDAAAAAANALTVAQSKADASTVQSLTNAVTQQGQDLIAQGQALTAIDVSIGDAGGENLLYNPAFTKVNTVDLSVPDGWARDGAAPNNSSMVESWLNAGERAFRSAVTGVTSGSPYLSLIPASTRRVKVGGSQTVTSSIYARRAATSGLLSLRLYFQWLNASGGVISAPFSTLNPISVDGSRHTLTAVAPADAVAAVVYYRVHAPTTTATNGTFELARPQVEYGSRASGWRDSGQVNAANNAATSTAVENLTSTVNQQGDNLSSVAGRTTSLENGLTTTNQNVTTAQQAAQAAATAAGGKGEVIYGSTAPAADKRLAQNLWIDTTGNANTPKRWNGSTWLAVTDKVATDAATAAASALSQVATKAEASAVNSLTNRVSNAEGTLSSNSSDITQLKNSIGTAQPFVAGKSWEFIGSTLGWVGTISGSTFTAGPLFATAGKCPNLQCNFTPAIAGAENPYLRIRLRRRNTTRSGAQMYWANEDGGLAEARRMAWTISLTTNDWQDIEFDLSGHAGWNGKNIIAIRLDMMNSVDASGEIDIAYIAVGRRSAAASAQAVASLESNVTQQGGNLTAEGLRIDGLYTSVADANAAIQNEAKARADGDGALSQQIQTTQSSLGATNASVQQISTAQTGLNNRVNAQYSVKVAVTQNGVYALGGIGVGIQNQSGVLQSVVAVLADQFAVINAAGNGYVSPFAIQGGQVFMNDAFIRDGSIINAKIQDAAISNAKIANGAITSAKIGVAEIDTLRIRGNAVTVPVSASSPGIVYGAGEGQWRDLIAIGVQMDEGGYITAQYSCYQGFGSGIRKYQFRMEINGLVIAEGGGDWADGFPNLMGSIGVGPGYFVITVKWWGENAGVSVKNHTLYAMGTKR